MFQQQSYFDNFMAQQIQAICLDFFVIMLHSKLLDGYSL